MVIAAVALGTSARMGMGIVTQAMTAYRDIVEMTIVTQKNSLLLRVKMIVV